MTTGTMRKHHIDPSNEWMNEHCTRIHFLSTGTCLKKKKMKWNQNDKNIKYLVRTKNNDENKGEEEKLSWL